MVGVDDFVALRVPDVLVAALLFGGVKAKVVEGVEREVQVDDAVAAKIVLKRVVIHTGGV